MAFKWVFSMVLSGFSMVLRGFFHGLFNGFSMVLSDPWSVDPHTSLQRPKGKKNLGFRKGCVFFGEVT